MREYLTENTIIRINIIRSKKAPEKRDKSYIKKTLFRFSTISVFKEAHLVSKPPHVSSIIAIQAIII